MDGTPRISDAEWEVMNVLWDEHPLAANDVAERLPPARKWSPRTVKTLLGRLVRKAALGLEGAGRHYLYRLLVTRETCVR